MFKISVSKDKTFESCKRKYQYNYILKLPKRSFTFFAFGKMLHMVLENFHKELLIDPAMNQSKVMARCFKEALKLEGPKFTDEEKRQAYDIVDEYLQLLSEQDTPARIIGVERQFSLDIEGVALLNGMIDRTQIDPDGVMHVIDYKTSKSMKYYEDDMFQLMVYAYVLMTEDPTLKTIRGSYMFLKHKFAMITRDFERDEVMKIGPKIIADAKAMQEETEFPANPSFMCNYCEFSESCSEGKAAIMPRIHKTGQTTWT